MNRLYTLIFSFLFTFTFAQKVSVMSGAWNSGSTWSPFGVPITTSSVTILSSHNVVLNKSLTGGSKIAALVTVNGTLKDETGIPNYNVEVGSGGQLVVDGRTVIEGTLEVKNGGILVVKAGDTLSTGGASFDNSSMVLVETNAVMMIYGNMTNNNNSNGIIINGELNVIGDYFGDGAFEGGNNSAINGSGKVTTTGCLQTEHFGTVFGSTVDCCPGPCAAQGGLVGGLPIELVYFNAFASENNEMVHLNWATATETNNDYFTIEKSLDGKNFMPIKQLSGAGTSSAFLEYSLIDENITSSIMYYRLKQTDYDGAFAYSAIVVVGGLTSENNLMVYPNPGNANEISVQVNFENEKNVVVSLYDLQGKELVSSSIDLAANDSNIINLSQYFTMPVKGMYMLKVEGAGKVNHQRVIVK